MSILDEHPDKGQNNIQYNEQIVAFIDILGFSEMINSAQGDYDRACETINKISNAISQAVEKNLDCRLLPKDKPQPTDPVFRVFSDCICVSSDCISTANVKKEYIDHYIFYFLLNLLYVQAELILHGIYIRGGVTINKHFYNDKMIFSSALVDAYKLESKNAIYPRILIHESVVRELRELTHDADLSGLNAVIKQDADGLAFLDYLEYISECDDYNGMYEYMNRHKESVLQNINGPLSPEVKQKYLWVARYHNQKVRESFSDEEYQALLIDEKLLQYNSSVFEIELVIIPFTSTVECINNGFFVIHANEKWEGYDKATKYVKDNCKDYILDDHSWKMFKSHITAEQLVSDMVEADCGIDKTIVLE